MVSWGYVTGFFDGEGTVICGEKIGISISNTHKKVLLKVQEFLCSGHIRLMSPTVHRLGRKPIFVLRISRNDDLRRILPRLIARSVVKQSKLKKLLGVVLKRRGVKAAFEWWRDVDVPALVKRYQRPDGSMETLAREYGVSGTAMYKLFLRKGIRRKPWGCPKGRVVPAAERANVSRAKKAFWSVPSNRRRMAASMTGVRHKKKVA